MSRVYTQADFEGVVTILIVHYPFFAQRADLIDQEFGGDYRNQITVVAGGGWGYLLDELSQRQWNRVYSLDRRGVDYAAMNVNPRSPVRGV